MNIKNWSVEKNYSSEVWQYKNRELYIYLVYCQDHYNENGDAVMKWRGHLKVGSNITVDVNNHVLCEDKSKEGAFHEIRNWAFDLMEQFNSDFEQKINELQIKSTLEEYEAYKNSNEK